MFTSTQTACSSSHPFGYNPSIEEEKSIHDLVLLCQGDEELITSSELLIKHSLFFETALSWSFVQNHIKGKPVDISPYPKQILTIVIDFLETEHLPEEIAKEDLLQLIEIIEFLLLKDRAQEEKLQNALVGKLKRDLLTRENALDLFEAGRKHSHFTWLRWEAVKLLWGTNSPSEFLAIADSVKAFPRGETIYFLQCFVPHCQINYSECDRDQLKKIFELVKCFGSEEQVKACMECIAGQPPTDEKLFSFLKNGSCIDGLDRTETARYCTRLLFTRIDNCLRRIGEKGDFSQGKIRGVVRKSGLWSDKRVKLPADSVTLLTQFAKVASQLCLHLPLWNEAVKQLPPIQQNWVLSKTVSVHV